MQRKNIVASKISPKIEILRSPIHGQGMFARQNINKGEVVFIKGGHILSKDELYSSETINSYLPIDDAYFIGAMDEEEEPYVKLYINHSCSPNCGMRGEITFVAMEDIKKGDELTCDYAMIDNEDYQFVCDCRSKNCRKIVTGFDWKKKDIQRRYANYFARYLLDKINQ